MALIYSYKNTPNSRTSIDFFPGVLKDSREGGESPDHVVYGQIKSIDDRKNSGRIFFVIKHF